MSDDTVSLIIGFLGALLGGGLTTLGNWISQRQANQQDQRRIAFEREKWESEQATVRLANSLAAEREREELIRKTVTEAFEAVSHVAYQQETSAKGGFPVDREHIARAKSALSNWLMLVPGDKEINEAIEYMLNRDGQKFAKDAYGLSVQLTKALLRLDLAMKPTVNNEKK